MAQKEIFRGYASGNSTRKYCAVEWSKRAGRSNGAGRSGELGHSHGPIRLALSSAFNGTNGQIKRFGQIGKVGQIGVCVQ